MKTEYFPGRTWLLTLALSVVLAACGDGGTGLDDRIAGGVDLDVLFAPPTQSEIAAVSTEWAARSPIARGVVVEDDRTISSLGVDLRLRIVSHVVDGTLRHYGAVLTPVGLVGPAPVIVYAHGGDSGVSLDQVLLTVPALGSPAGGFVWVVPSFRSESISLGVRSWTSEGTPSPWDRDVDDTMALLDAAFDVEPVADSTAVAVLGFSRGAGVGLLMGVRDERVSRVVDFFGPTDFFGPFVQDVVEEALDGSLRDLPGLGDLDRDVLQALVRGEIDIPAARRELIRRSPVYFVERLPAVQVHHGTADDIVDVSQAESLISALQADGRTAPDFQPFLYDGGTHNPLALVGALQRTIDFLVPLLP